VSGGGVALIYSLKSIEAIQVDNNDQKVGVEIVRKALTAPCRQIAANAGADGSIVVGKILDSKDHNHGYDAQKDRYGDMLQFGIIDPTKVVRTALQDAASVASLMITTEAMIGEKPEPKPAMPGPDMGGMGGMGGMGY
ncbi:MAG: chaperonin GroEL, partial [Alphaproteobacteria bacterium]|nr:chaperonin GroEL [Alphaproteobacteria bacterium]